MSKYIDENGFAHFLGKLKTLLDGKVNTESGKGLSTNDYTTAEKNKLEGIAANANNYSLPTASDQVKGGVKIGAGLTMTGEVLSADVQSVPVMTGASSSAAGAAGTVPAPAAGDQAKYLQGDGTWNTPAARHGTGAASVVEGGNNTNASGDYSHAEGGGAVASGTSSHAEGSGATASGTSSHAEGGSTVASGGFSHAEGATTTASGDYSHAEGWTTLADGEFSHAEGNHTVANHKSQHVFGEYNIADESSAESDYRGTYVEIVGNGTGSSAKSNARTLDWSGNEVLAGSLTTGGDITVPSGSKFNGSGAGLTNIPASAVPVMTGATSSANGTAGLVPAPESSERNYFLKGNGEWASVNVTDEKVKVTTLSSSTDAEYPLMAVNNTSPTSSYTYDAAIPTSSDKRPKINGKTGVLSAYKFSGDGSELMSLNGSNIYSGTVAAARIADLPASKITSGTFDAARIPDLSGTYALKSDITSMYKHKGSVSSTSNLPSSGQTAGDVYNVTATGMNYVWTGSEWDALGEIFTINSMTTTEIDAAFVTAGLTAA